ncbi:hypothetical protein IHQ56_14265 [Methylobacillus flagellatus]|uniref:hypothetical protein n=1 Tax=Methylobacillus flagellatus TaxID=405 RepID=UPI002853F2A5|nr:hypothetical protein [Methylobacillus flagellatus]MDR5172973.1 hypothetical protein [Methylobacillus flagellatus]
MTAPTQQQREAAIRVLAAAIDPEANRVLEAMAGKIERHKLSYPEQMLMGIAVGARWADAKTKAEAALAAVLPVIREAALEGAIARCVPATVPSEWMEDPNWLHILEGMKRSRELLRALAKEAGV